MLGTFRSASPVAKVLIVLSFLFLLTTSVSLCKRAYRGETDFSVFYRAAVSLSNGAGGEIYAMRDEPTGWYNCIPPIGMVPFMALVAFAPVVAGALWAAFNIGLLALCFILLRKIYAKLTVERIYYEQTLPWVLVLLGFFGGVCVQTGQTSILFVACWLGYILTTSQSRPAISGLLLAIPACIKLYPLLFGIVPLLRRKLNEVTLGIAWIVVLSVAVPYLFFGTTVIELLVDFFKYQVLDPGGRVMTAASPRAVSNQGLDAVLLRYLAHIPEVHDGARGFPHLSLDPDAVLLLANVLRLAIIGATVVASVSWIKKTNEDPPLVLMALWCAALYMILPGAKGRYAIYALPALAVMIASAKRELGAGRIADSRRIAALAVLCTALLLQIVPDATLNYGVGFIGQIILWVFMLQSTLSRESLSSRSSENHAAGSKRAADVL